jgi:thioredoxin-related protein
MIKNLTFPAITLLIFMVVCSPESPETGKSSPQLYDTARNAIADIDSAVQLAGIENKQVLIHVGGNWCPWCIRLHHFIQSHPQLDSIIMADYIPIRVSYSKENKSPEAMKRLGFPERFGFPVLVILDGEGNVLHIQDTYYLEQGDSYSEEKISRFLLNWNRKAISPETYSDSD